MQRVSVLFALTQPVRGGVEEVVLALARRLHPSEFRLALAPPAAVLEAFARDLAGVAIETEAVEAGAWRRRDEIARLSKFIARLKPDIVNAHLFRSTAVAAPLARWHGARVVETYHGREGWRRGLLGGSFLPDRLLSRLVDRVIAVSEAARAFLIAGKGYDPRKIVVVPNGRDLSVFRPGAGGQAVRKELGIDRATPLVGVIGRLEEQKGHVYMLDAWPSVLSEFPDARLLLVGAGSLRGALERRVNDLGVAPSVLFAGFRADVPRVLDALDVLALPSLYEGTPLTVIEASRGADRRRPSAAYTRAGCIVAKLASTLARQRYPHARLEAIVVSDGSSDATDALVQRYPDDRVRLVRQEPRAGKSPALNRGVAAARGEVLVF